MKRKTIVQFRKSKYVAHVKGHAVYCLDEDQDDRPYPIYRYADDNTIVPDEDRERRPCKLCGKKSTRTGYDPCLGELPGVVSACCGHGAGQGYLTFANGIVLKFNPIAVEKCKL